ncbi:Peptidyl-trna hydrolase [Thalictrum thalictroides]|uniref:peptidyl-tRNA hydrolase n=1 Tax=Thalictrum thalictroides TaxID=46969 RepID=A0A7J6VQQ3_THATH|nr:Peptidyl-trna hydrolase [Thalictrum thalictroides]
MDLSLLSAFLVGASCLAVGYLLGGGDPPKPFSLSSSTFFSSFLKKKNNNSTASAVANDTKKTKLPKMTMKPPLEIEKLAEILEDFKMVLIVRNDLKMGKGKIAAQCSHATLGIYKKLLHRAPKALSRWEMCGQVKVVLKTETEDDLLILQENAKSMNLPTHITIDAGRTQIAPNSRTVMAILGPADLVDDVTGRLKLL